MFSALMAVASAKIAETRQGILRLVIGLVLALAAIIMLMSALLSAMFLFVSFHYGPVAGYLSVAGVALVIAIIALVYAFAAPRNPSRARAAAAVQPVLNSTTLGAAAVEAATGMGVKAAGSAATQAYDTARLAGERIRSIGAAVAANVTGERKTPVSRKVIINATLTAVLVGLIIGRRM